MLTSRALFLYKFFKEPATIGSITPSSGFLTKKLLADLPWNDLRTIVELGAGTGVFTAYIAAHARPGAHTLIIEQDREMAAALKSRYPSFRYGFQAEKLDWYLTSQDLPQADCIISGLPFAAFSPALRAEIMVAVKRSLKPGGIFTAFQYTLQMEQTLRRHFSAVSIRFVPFNLPPAFIYRCTK